MVRRVVLACALAVRVWRAAVQPPWVHVHLLLIRRQVVGNEELSLLHEGSLLQRLGAASPDEEASPAENASSMPAGAQTS